jgi:sugar phosphate isomerase/epimerase
VATVEMNAACFSGVVYSAIGRKIDGFPDERYWKWSADALKEVAKFAADLGITSVSNPLTVMNPFSSIPVIRASSSCK